VARDLVEVYKLTCKEGGMISCDTKRTGLANMTKNLVRGTEDATYVHPWSRVFKQFRYGFNRRTLRNNIKLGKDPREENGDVIMGFVWNNLVDEVHEAPNRLVEAYHVIITIRAHCNKVVQYAVTIGAVLSPTKLVRSVVNVLYVAVDLKKRKSEGDIDKAVEHNTWTTTHNSGDRRALLLDLGSAGERVTILHRDPRSRVVHKHVDKECNSVRTEDLGSKGFRACTDEVWDHTSTDIINRFGGGSALELGKVNRDRVTVVNTVIIDGGTDVT